MEQKNNRRFSKMSKFFINNKFINKILLKGKKIKAEVIFFKALKQVKQRNNLNSSDFMYTIINKTCPAIEVRSIRVGGIMRQVPGPIKLNRQLILGIRWVVNSARTRSNRTFIIS